MIGSLIYAGKHRLNLMTFGKTLAIFLHRSAFTCSLRPHDSHLRKDLSQSLVLCGFLEILRITVFGHAESELF